jgi:hypothetical protein
MINKKVAVTTFVIAEVLVLAGGKLISTVSPDNSNNRALGTPEGLLLLWAFTLPLVLLASFIAGAVTKRD